MTKPSEAPKFAVLVNGEGQYSIWPNFKQAPAGWLDTGFLGDEEACMAHVDEVWTDMRPISLQKAMES